MYKNNSNESFKFATQPPLPTQHKTNGCGILRILTYQCFVFTHKNVIDSNLNI